MPKKKTDKTENFDDDHWDDAETGRPKRDSATQDALMMRAWELRINKFKSYRSIAEELGITIPAVQNLIQRVFRKNLAKFDSHVQSYKMQQLGMLEYMAQEAIEAWEHSKQPQVITTTTQQLSNDDNRDDDKGRKRKGRQEQVIDVEPRMTTAGEMIYMPISNYAEHTNMRISNQTVQTRVAQSPGDPRYLEAARAAMGDIRKLLGLDAPVRLKRDDLDRLSDDEIERLLGS
jgi:hypothetical protein